MEVRSGGEEEKDKFCNAFDTCVIWDTNEQPPSGTGGSSSGGEAKKSGAAGAANSSSSTSVLDCSTLTTCDWPGKHEQFLGDGICHENMPGCYNSPICSYDGGDCCEDTCKYPGGSKLFPNQSTGETNGYGECGMEGYACRDPRSTQCRPGLAKTYKEFCDKIDTTTTAAGSETLLDDFFSKEESLPVCSSSDTLYRLLQFDSWGDGWDTTVLTLKEAAAGGGGGEVEKTITPVYQGGLQYGSEGTVHVCLSKVPKCYQVTVENGVWGNEISWEIRPLLAGAPALGAGGSPTDCTLPIGGVSDGCQNTCNKSKPDTKINDPNYKSYKDMESCIEQKCLIQVGNCAQDSSCSGCMQGEIPDYCYANSNFNTLIDCSMCTCSENRPKYCDAKSSANSDGGSSAASHAGLVIPAANMETHAAGGTIVCGPEQTLKGTNALVQFSTCAVVDSLMAMVTDFDNDNFGSLDLFEECAHTYDEQPLHGGKSALDCMKILHNLIDDEDPTTDGDNQSPFKPAKNAKGESLPENVSKAISTLAHNLYHDAATFCECSANANKEAPMCSSFINFKTLLYEAIDACKSLDAIDCAAWEEFYVPCKKNLIQMYEELNFDNHEQCVYVENMCGGAGPFPAFRRLDCGGEIAKPAWDFHTMYARGCLKDSSSSFSGSSNNNNHVPISPAVSPVTPLTPKTAPEKKPYVPWKPSGSDEKKPYKSPDADPIPDTSPSYKEKANHHFLTYSIILMVLGGVGYVVHKKRRENFNYVRFRQMRAARNYAGGLGTGFGASSGGDYTGVSMQESCSFEPPSLPPMPSSNML